MCQPRPLLNFVQDTLSAKMMQKSSYRCFAGASTLFHQLNIAASLNLFFIAYSVQPRSNLYKYRIVRFCWSSLWCLIKKTSYNTNDLRYASINFTIGQLLCILAYQWSFILYDVIFIRHYKMLRFCYFCRLSTYSSHLQPFSRSLQT